MVSSSVTYWTLAQSAAWVMFRDALVVDKFPSDRPTHWGAYMMYPGDWDKPVVEENWRVLFRALEAGRLVATGRRAVDGIREPIPSSIWIDLIPDVDAGPYLRLQSGAAVRPWTDILVSRSDVEQIWSRANNPNGRAKYDKVWIRDQYVKLKKLHDSMNIDELIEEVQSEYQIAFDGVEPARTTVQRYTKDL